VIISAEGLKSLAYMLQNKINPNSSESYFNASNQYYSDRNYTSTKIKITYPEMFGY